MNNTINAIKSDFLVIGTGISGLAFALKVADLGKVIVLNKTKSEEGNSAMAQGGIAAVISREDSF